MTAQPISRLTDDELVVRFRNGDDAAFSEMHRRYRSALTAFARRMLQGSGHDADDVVQEAFIRAYRGLRVTDRAMALRPWLYMIVRNRALDELRAPQRTSEYDDEFQMRPVADSDPAQRFAGSEEMRTSRRRDRPAARAPAARPRHARVRRPHARRDRPRAANDRAGDEVAHHPRALEPPGGRPCRVGGAASDPQAAFTGP